MKATLLVVSTNKHSSRGMRRVLLCRRSSEHVGDVDEEEDIRRRLGSKSINVGILTEEIDALDEDGFLEAYAFKHRLDPEVVSVLDGRSVKITSDGIPHYYLHYHTVEVDSRLFNFGDNVVRIVGPRSQHDVPEKVVIKPEVEAYLEQMDRRIAELEGLLALAEAQIYRQGTHTNDPPASVHETQ